MVDGGSRPQFLWPCPLPRLALLCACPRGDEGDSTPANRSHTSMCVFLSKKCPKIYREAPGSDEFALVLQVVISSFGHWDSSYQPTLDVGGEYEQCEPTSMYFISFPLALALGKAPRLPHVKVFHNTSVSPIERRTRPSRLHSEIY